MRDRFYPPEYKDVSVRMVDTRHEVWLVDRRDVAANAAEVPVVAAKSDKASTTNSFRRLTCFKSIFVKRARR